MEDANERQKADQNQSQGTAGTARGLCPAYQPLQGRRTTICRAVWKIDGMGGPRGLLRFPETMVLSIYHDAPKTFEI